MKQTYLNMLKQENKISQLVEKLRPKIEYYCGINSLSPIAILDAYFKYIEKMRFTGTIKQTRQGLKIKIIKEQLGGRQLKCNGTTIFNKGV